MKKLAITLSVFLYSSFTIASGYGNCNTNSDAQEFIAEEKEQYKNVSFIELKNYDTDEVQGLISYYDNDLNKAGYIVLCKSFSYNGATYESVDSFIIDNFDFKNLYQETKESYGELVSLTDSIEAYSENYLYVEGESVLLDDEKTVQLRMAVTHINTDGDSVFNVETAALKLDITADLFSK